MLNSSSTKAPATVSPSSNSCPFTALNIHGFLSLDLPRLSLLICLLFLTSLPSQKWVFLLQHPPRLRSWRPAFVLCPPCSLIWANSIIFMLTAQTLFLFVFLQDETNFRFCRGAERALSKITAELLLCSPSSLKTSAVSNYLSQQIMPNATRPLLHGGASSAICLHFSESFG